MLEQEQDDFNDFAIEFFDRIDQITDERCTLKLQEQLNKLELDQIKEK